MKIAIPVDEKSLESNVCVSFGRTPHFLIYDTDTQKSVFLDNSAAASTIKPPNQFGQSHTNLVK